MTEDETISQNLCLRILVAIADDVSLVYILDGFCDLQLGL